VCRFKASLELINQVDDAKFQVILTRIIKKLHKKDRKAFSEGEEEQLAGLFEFTVDQLRTVRHLLVVSSEPMLTLSGAGCVLVRVRAVGLLQPEQQEVGSTAGRVGCAEGEGMA
jgi:hypothetical protein